MLLLLGRPLLMRVMGARPVMVVRTMLTLSLGTLVALAPLMIHDPP